MLLRPIILGDWNSINKLAAKKSSVMSALHLSVGRILCQGQPPDRGTRGLATLSAPCEIAPPEGYSTA